MPGEAIGHFGNQGEDDITVLAQLLDQIGLAGRGKTTKMKRADRIPVRCLFGPDSQKRPASQKRNDTTRLTRMQVTIGK